MNAKLPILFIVLFPSLNVHCTLNETGSPANLGATNDSISKAEWTIIDSIDYETLNADIVPGKPTMDVGVYLPSNLDPEFKKSDSGSHVNRTKGGQRDLCAYWSTS